MEHTARIEGPSLNVSARLTYVRLQDAPPDADAPVLFLDLDNTLYPKRLGIGEQMATRIRLFFEKCLGFPTEESEALGQRFYLDYGLAVKGLVRHFAIDTADYDAFVDGGLDLSGIRHAWEKGACVAHKELPTRPPRAGSPCVRCPPEKQAAVEHAASHAREATDHLDGAPKSDSVHDEQRMPTGASGQSQEGNSRRTGQRACLQHEAGPRAPSLLDDMLDRCHARLWVFTNAGINHARRVLTHLGVLHRFEGVVYCDYAEADFPAKPDRLAYDRAMAAAGVAGRPELCFFADDSATNVRVAREVGWTAVHIDELDEELERVDNHRARCTCDVSGDGSISTMSPADSLPRPSLRDSRVSSVLDISGVLPGLFRPAHASH